MSPAPASPSCPPPRGNHHHPLHSTPNTTHSPPPGALTFIVLRPSTHKNHSRGGDLPPVPRRTRNHTRPCPWGRWPRGPPSSCLRRARPSLGPQEIPVRGRFGEKHNTLNGFLIYPRGRPCLRGTGDTIAFLTHIAAKGDPGAGRGGGEQADGSEPAAGLSRPRWGRGLLFVFGKKKLTDMHIHTLRKSVE